MGPAGRRARDLHNYALRVQSKVRELAKQGVRLPDQVHGFLLLRRANLSTQASHCHHDAGSKQLVIWRCEEGVQALGVCEIPKQHDARGTHTVYVSQAKEASVAAQEQEGDSDVEKRHRFGRNRRSRDTVGLQRVTTVVWRPAGKPRLQTRERAHQRRGNRTELRADTTSKS